MFRLLRLTAMLILLCAGAIGLSRAIGGTQPNPIAAWFTNPDGSACDKPCLFGIQPGVTKYDAAMEILSIHPATKDMQTRGEGSNGSVVGAGFWNANLCLEVWHGSNNEVYAIYLWSHNCYLLDMPIDRPLNVSLGQMVVTLGNPDSAATSDEFGDGYYFFEGKLTFDVSSGKCAILPNTIYDQIRLSNLDDRNVLVPAWRGFASRIFYLPSYSAGYRC